MKIKIFCVWSQVTIIALLQNEASSVVYFWYLFGQPLQTRTWKHLKSLLLSRSVFLSRFWVSKWHPKILEWHPKFWKPRYGFALYWSKTIWDKHVFLHVAIATDGCSVIGPHNFLAQKLEAKIVSLVRVSNRLKKLKNYEFNYLHPKRIQNLGKETTAQSTSDMLPKHQISEISLKTSEMVTLMHIIHVCTLGRSQLCDAWNTHQSTLLVLQMLCLFPHWQSTAAPSSCYIW